MRIFQYITPSQIGGAEIHVLTLARKLTERGHRVTVICPEGRALTAELIDRGLDVWAPRTWGKLDPLTPLRMARLLRRERADVLHTHLSTASLMGGIAGRLAGVPVVSTVHGLNHRTCFMRAQRIVAVSNAVAQHLEGQGVLSSRIVVIYNGVEVKRYAHVADSAPVRTALGIAPGDVLIGAVGRLVPEKGHRYLIEALALLLRQGMPARLVIVGEGRARGELQETIRRLNLTDRVALPGFQADVVPYAAALDIFCLPSLREGLSLSALEAMALAKPVIASRVGGTPEVVADGETGVLVEPANPEALAEALAALAADPERCRAMGLAGRRRVGNLFDIERAVDRIEQLYQQEAASAKC